LPDSASSLNPFDVRLTALLDPTGSSAIMPGPKNVSNPFGSRRSERGSGRRPHLGFRPARRQNRAQLRLLPRSAYYVTTQSDPTKPDPALNVYLPISPTPFASNLPQAVAVQPELLDKTDPYFRGFDMNNADTYLFNEWLRDMTVNGLPNLTLLRLPHDHFGSTSTAIAGLNTPWLQMADNDYAIGRVVETISHSQYWSHTAIFILEDSQNGGDHIDSHRSFVYVISAYSKRGVTICTNYNTVNVLRAIEDLLGIDHLNQSDANAAPMSDVFTHDANLTPYTRADSGKLVRGAGGSEPRSGMRVHKREDHAPVARATRRGLVGGEAGGVRFSRRRPQRRRGI
jgi:hypothetical protein